LHHSQRRVARRAAAAENDRFETVLDIMQPGRKVFTCNPDDAVDMALELLVDNCISGLPVVDADNVVVGVVSDFDLLALEAGKSPGNLFPSIDDTWSAFNTVKSILSKGSGKKVGDVMTKMPLTVKTSTTIDEATSLLLQKRIRRLPVVDDAGHLVGIVSRSNMIRAAFQLRRLKIEQEAKA